MCESFMILANINQNHIKSSHEVVLDTAETIVLNKSESDFINGSTYAKKTDIFLSSTLSPTFLIPWEDDFYRKEYCRSRITDYLQIIYPRLDEEFYVKFTFTKFRGPVITSVVRRNLIEKIQTAFAEVTIRSVQGLVPATIKALWPKLKDATLVVNELKSTQIIHIENHFIRFIHTIPLSETYGLSIISVAQREVMLEGFSFNQDNLVVLNQEGGILNFGWKNIDGLEIGKQTLLGPIS
jgi:hypothetical protein